MSVACRGRAVLFAAAWLAACARSRSDASTDDAAGALAPPVPLTVENRHRFDVNVYVTRGGAQQLRLGTVVSSTSKALLVPASYAAAGFQLVADPIGPSAGATYRSERVIVTGAGQRVVWTLETNLVRSSVGVY